MDKLFYTLAILVSLFAYFNGISTQIADLNKKVSILTQELNDYEKAN